MNIFHASFSVSIVDLEQGNVCWVYILSLTSEISVNNMVVIQVFPELIPGQVPHFLPPETLESLWFSGVYRRYKMGTLTRKGLIALHKNEVFLYGLLQ